MKKTKIIVSSIMASITGLLGLIGISGFCCTLTGAFILSFFGLASISTFLIYNNKWFLIVSAVFIIFALVGYYNFKNNKNCSIKKNIKK